MSASVIANINSQRSELTARIAFAHRFKDGKAKRSAQLQLQKWNELRKIFSSFPEMLPTSPGSIGGSLEAFCLAPQIHCIQRTPVCRPHVENEWENTMTAASKFLVYSAVKTLRQMGTELPSNDIQKATKIFKEAVSYTADGKEGEKIRTKINILSQNTPLLAELYLKCAKSFVDSMDLSKKILFAKLPSEEFLVAHPIDEPEMFKAIIKANPEASSSIPADGFVNLDKSKYLDYTKSAGRMLNGFVYKAMIENREINKAEIGRVKEQFEKVIQGIDSVLADEEEKLSGNEVDQFLSAKSWLHFALENFGAAIESSKKYILFIKDDLEPLAKEAQTEKTWGESSIVVKVAWVASSWWNGRQAE